MWLKKLEHSLIAALLACLGFGLSYWFKWITYYPAVIGITIFIVRELTQAEYRWIEKFGNGLRANMPRFGCLDPRIWDFHSLTDWIFPFIVNSLLAIIWSYLT